LRAFDWFLAESKFLLPPFARSYDQEAVEPKTWAMTPDDLRVRLPTSISSVYEVIDKAHKLPFHQASRRAPDEPLFRIPKWRVELVWTDGGLPVDLGSDVLARIYATDVQSAHEAAHEREVAEALLHEKSKEAEDVLRRLARFELAYQDYVGRAKEGIEKHFRLALELLPLPLPYGYPWTTFYEPTERVLQINQRVPLPADIEMNRSDSCRAVAKRDADFALRRVIPTIALHVAQHAARSDLFSDVNVIAVNCWVRFDEKQTGRLKDAFIASLNVSPTRIDEIDINNADALEAFRSLGGIFAFAPEEIVPIEPTIRLDRQDKRFIEGKELLSGLAQGQNLAT
jgi:hypothetical protein